MFFRSSSIHETPDERPLPAAPAEPLPYDRDLPARLETATLALG